MFTSKIATYTFMEISCGKWSVVWIIYESRLSSVILKVKFTMYNQICGKKTAQLDRVPNKMITKTLTHLILLLFLQITILKQKYVHQVVNNTLK